jgi:hypothetical protein
MPWHSYDMLLSQRADREWTAPPTPFNALLQGAKAARDMRDGGRTRAGGGATSAAGVPVQPWLAPRDFVCSDPGIPGNTTSHFFGSDMWQEHLFHVLLATGATDVLWWKPGAMRPLDVGVPLLSAALSELALLLNGDSSSLCGSPTPVEGAGVAIDDWSEPYVLSGAMVRCSSSSSGGGGGGGGGGSGGNATVTERTLYRFTPRCLADGSIEKADCTAAPAGAHNGTAATFKIGSGFSISPVAGGTIVVPEAPSAPLGFWVLAPPRRISRPE